MHEFLAEVAGTAILILIGNGSVANTNLRGSKAEGGGWIVVATAWGLAVAMAVYCVGRVSGAHINPAVTVALAAVGNFPWSQVPVYIAGQLAGAMVGAALVWLAFLGHWRETAYPEVKLACFCTSPALRKYPRNLLTEIIGTFLLLFGILAVADNAQQLRTAQDLDLSVVFSGGLQPLLVGFLVWAIGLSLGGPTGYAINPARDLGPRLMHRLLPIAGKGSSDWAYSWVPIAGPLIGGCLGAWTYYWLAF
ncbi:MAG: MIP/aquaporin family protein [Acidobacteriota bacterium]